MASKQGQLTKLVKKVVTHLEEECGCEVEITANSHLKIKFSNPHSGINGSITMATSPQSAEELKKHVRTNLRREMLRTGFSDKQTKEMKKNIRIIPTIDDTELDKFDNLLRFCNNRISLSLSQIKTLCDSRETLGMSYKFLSEHFGVSESTVYSILKEYGVIRSKDISD